LCGYAVLSATADQVKMKWGLFASL